jgi:hypothetical protein
MGLQPMAGGRQAAEGMDQVKSPSVPKLSPG